MSRIRFDGTPVADLRTLAALQLCHMQTVPFENLDVVAGVPVRTDTDWSVAKVVTYRRGGWCFELNGAFGALLGSLGFSVRNIAAAVLLGGPAVVADHLCLEVSIDGEPFLVDVGFGKSFTTPLALNNGDVQDGGSGDFQFIPSPQGTTLTQIVDGVPEAQYRFKRVHHELSDFSAISEQLRTDQDKHWKNKPFATRLLDRPTTRVTLTTDTLKLERDGKVSEEPVAPETWSDTLAEWFGMVAPDDARPT